MGFLRWLGRPHANGPARAPNRRAGRALLVELLEDRSLPSGVDLASATAILPNDQVSEAFQATAFWKLTLTQGGRFSAGVSGSGLDTRLSLLRSDGDPLIQSDARAPGDPDDLISQHLTAGTYYLRVEALTAPAGSYALTTQFQVSSLPFETTPTGGAPLGIASADFNNDNRLDVLTANYDSKTLSLLRGLGDGTFLPAVDVAIGAAPTALAVGDVNRDGYLDAVVAVAETNQVRILFGQSGGSFGAPQIWVMGPAPTAGTVIDRNTDGRIDVFGSVALADFNKDGWLDIVSANQATAQVVVRLNDQAGGFGNAVASASGALLGPGALAVGDFNGDGILDVATANLPPVNITGPLPATPRSVSILIGLGNGQFQVPIEYADSGILALAAADVNGDGRDDLITAQDVAGTVTLRLSIGGGYLGPPTILAVGRRAGAVLIRDVDHDGHLDILTSNIGSGDVSVLRGRSDGTFEEVRLYQVGLTTSGHFPGPLLVGDFTSDGNLDVLVGNLAIGTIPPPRSVTLLVGRGDATFVEVRDAGVGDAPNLAASADFNGDGLPDLAVPNQGSSDISILLGQGNGTFADQGRFATGRDPRRAVAGDFNRDGRMDLAIINTSSNDVSVLLGIGDGTFQAQRLYAVGASPWAMEVLDLNQDGILDVVTANRGSASISVLVGLGDGAFAPATSFATGTSPNGLAIGDVNGDGLLDILTPNIGTNDVSIFLGRDPGPLGGWTLEAQPRLAIGAPGPAALSGPFALALRDFNNDQRLDVLVVERSAKSLALFVGAGVGAAWTFGPREGISLGATPPTPNDVVVDDLNRDGKLDIVVNTGSGTEVLVLLGQTFTPDAATSRFAAARRFSVGTATLLNGWLTTADFNGDHMPDVAFSNQNSRSLAVLLSSMTPGDPSTWTFAPLKQYTVGAGPVSAQALDFNADGRLDLATVNKFSDDVSVLQGVGDGSFLAASVVANPVRSTPLVVDLNGDGAVEVVLVSATGQILLRRGRPNQPGAFEPALLVNLTENAEARDVALVATPQGLVLAALDVKGRALSFYKLQDDGTFARTVGPAVPGALPVQLEAGDFNGDGRTDLAVGVAGTSQVFLYFQDAAGGFGLPSAWPLDVGINPVAINIVDVNGDSRNDILVADGYSSDLSVIWSTGPLPFQTGSRFRASTGLYSMDSFQGAPVVHSLADTMGVAAGDVTGDGIPDLVVANAGTNTIAVLAGTGRDGFSNPTAAHTYQTGTRPSVVVTGRLDADAWLDVAVLVEGTGQIEVFRGSAAGLTRVAVLDAGNQPTGLTLADSNGDGHVDFVVGNRFGDVLILRGDGAGAFQPYQRAEQTMALAVADLNGDGRDDFVLANPSLDRVMVQYGQAGGFLQDRAQGLLAPAAVAAADLDRDGIADLIVANSGGNNIHVYRGLPGNLFGPAQQFFAGTKPVGLTVSDLDGNGLLDLVVANEGSNDVSILLGVGTSSADWGLTYGPRLNAGYDGLLGKQVALGPSSTTVADVDGDRILDLLVTNSQSNNVSLLLGTGNGFFNDQRPAIYNVGIDPRQTLIGNFDAAPGLDLIAVNAGSNNLTLISNIGALNAATTQIASGGSGPVQAIAGDFNGDLTMDLIVANNHDGLFTLLLGGLLGPSLTRSFASADLEHPTALALAEAGGGIIDIYATGEGRETVFRLSFDLNPVPVTATLPPAQGTVPAGLAALLTGPREDPNVDLAPSTAEAALPRFLVGLDNAPVGSRARIVGGGEVEPEKAPPGGQESSPTSNAIALLHAWADGACTATHYVFAAVKALNGPAEPDAEPLDIPWRRVLEAVFSWLRVDAGLVPELAPYPQEEMEGEQLPPPEAHCPAMSIASGAAPVDSMPQFFPGPSLPRLALELSPGVAFPLVNSSLAGALLLGIARSVADAQRRRNLRFTVPSIPDRARDG